jgi:large subunit ribosomal protein L19|tara:strand:+ start:2752 stop:3354 length:603 start_codon:yes stop_codon:yes gene_type:complete
MKNIEDINRASVKKILAKKKIPEFFAGDTIKVGVRIVEGKRERIQNFEGVCIAKKNRDINSSFTVRKISFGEGVERTFALYSPIVDSIKVIRSGKVKRAKLYYLRDRKGKSARISEKIKKKVGIDISEQTSKGHTIEAKVPPPIQKQTETDKVFIAANEKERKEELKKETVLNAKPKKEELQKKVLKSDTKKEELKTKKK